MTKTAVQFRIASYNTHKCRGIHGTISPDRVIGVIEELEMDILCLQEIVDAKGGTGKFDQADRIAEAFPKLHRAFGKTRPLHHRSCPIWTTAADRPTATPTRSIRRL